MAADIHTAAQREAERLMAFTGGGLDALRAEWRNAFPTGAVWGAARVTPTREQIAEVIASSGAYGFKWEQVRPMTRDAYLAAADAVLALMAGLAEGEKA